MEQQVEVSAATHAQGNPPRPTSWTVLLQLIALLPMPAVVLVQLTSIFPPVIVVASLLIVNAVTFFAYYFDKKRAAVGQWRISERTLHLTSLLGGWPMAFVGQRFLRHKGAKTEFQVIFWTTVIAHQLLCLGFLTKGTFGFLK